jgi:trafficking protein particle complex subunit 10
VSNNNQTIFGQNLVARVGTSALGKPEQRLGQAPFMSASSGSPVQRVLVSYSAPPIFLASPNWIKVYAALVAQLPLRNIHRKHPLKQSVKTIQELNVTFVALDTVSEEPTSQVPSTLLEKPLLHIFILHCEVS